MDQNFLVFIVDDNNVMQTLFPAMLKETCETEVFGTAEACLSRLAERTPDMFLLDVGLPGMDGYELCRRIRANQATADIPVTFVSGHDEESDLLAGYEAGGDDYIVKPASKGALLHKVKVAQRLREEKKRLFEQANESEMLASLMMSNMDEYAVVIQFIRRTTEATQAEGVAKAALQCMQGLRLDGVVQVRLGKLTLTLSANGRDHPLEASIMTHNASLGRLFEFKNRAAFNFPTISLMVNAMPVQEPELCGRIRDHLAIAAEVAHARLEAIQATEDNRRKQEGLQTAMNHVSQAIQTLNQKELQTRSDAATVVFHMQEELANTFISLGLSEQQENHLDQIVRSHIDQLNNLYKARENTQTVLAELGQYMQQLAQ